MCFKFTVNSVPLYLLFFPTAFSFAFTSPRAHAMRMPMRHHLYFTTIYVEAAALYELRVQAGLEQRLDGRLERGALQQGAAQRQLGHLREDVAQLRQLGLYVGGGLRDYRPPDDLEVEARQP